uniref:Uncharacterized protein n=1 Tax=Anopheles coluzzii TaxID=1518534 RepID=A0A8W7P5W7_ANOCL
LVLKLHEPVAAVEWLIDHKLLQAVQLCRKCEQPMRLRKNVKGTKDRCKWVCMHRTYAGSFFEGSRLTINVSVAEVVKQLQLSKITVIDHFRNIRLLLFDDVAMLAPSKIGGPGKTVQIDETKITSRKYNRGRLTRTE